MTDKTDKEEIRDEIFVLRDKTIPRLYEVIEEKFTKIEGYLQEIRDKFFSLKEEHSVTKTKVETLWWVCGAAISGIIGLFFWIVKDGK